MYKLRSKLCCQSVRQSPPAIPTLLCDRTPSTHWAAPGSQPCGHPRSSLKALPPHHLCTPKLGGHGWAVAPMSQVPLGCRGAWPIDNQPFSASPTWAPKMENSSMEVGGFHLQMGQKEWKTPLCARRHSCDPSSPGSLYCLVSQSFYSFLLTFSSTVVSDCFSTF